MTTRKANPSTRKKRNVEFLDKALEIHRKHQQSNLSQKELARQYKMTEGVLSTHLRFAESNPRIHVLMREGLLSFSHARELIYRVPEEHQLAFAERFRGLLFNDFLNKIMEQYDSGDRYFRKRKQNELKRLLMEPERRQYSAAVECLRLWEASCISTPEEIAEYIDRKPKWIKERVELGAKLRALTLKQIQALK